jgi:hypothetical protein
LVTGLKDQSQYITRFGQTKYKGKYVVTHYLHSVRYRWFGGKCVIPNSSVLL